MQQCKDLPAVVKRLPTYQEPSLGEIISSILGDCPVVWSAKLDGRDLSKPLQDGDAEELLELASLADTHFDGWRL